MQKLIILKHICTVLDDNNAWPRMVLENSEPEATLSRLIQQIIQKYLQANK